jgi:hypothetical protein
VRFLGNLEETANNACADCKYRSISIHTAAHRSGLLSEEKMLYFKVDTDSQVVEISNTIPSQHAGWMTRHDFKSLEHAGDIAKSATQATGKLHLPVDSGSGVWPRFDVIEAPAVGDDVSYAFNGDYYPCGQIKSISASHRVITTTEGQKFYRRRESGCWKLNGIWSLVDGHRHELNPSF